ncbi:hypothetical protein BH09BAC5_BH09BAC5_20100 [soil metagenome]
MKRSHSFLLLTTVAILMVAFSSFSKGKKKQKFPGYTPIENGSYFMLHKKGAGIDQVDTGGAVFAKIKFKTPADSVFLDINVATNAPSYPMRIDQPQFKGDFLDIIAKLHQGDSASFFVKMDSLKKYYGEEFKFEPKFDTMEYLGFAIEIDSIYSRQTVSNLKAMAEAEKAEKQKKAQQSMEIMKPIQDTARLREGMLKENDFALLSDYIKTKWKGPKNPDNDGIFFQETFPGTGQPIQPGMYVSIKYTGKYLDGTIFDSNTLFEGQDLLTFRYGVDQMIEGFSICVGKMHVGSKAIFILPPGKGYKDGLTRIFEVEIVSVKQ